MAITAFAGGSAVSTDQAPRRRSWVALVLLLPGILYLVLFFVVPLFSLVLTSLESQTAPGSGVYQYGFNVQNYSDSVVQFLPQILRSFLYALLATVFALLFSYPLAYFIGVKARRWPLLQSFMLILVIAPFFISFLLRTLAWKTILADEGPVVGVLKALSLMGPQSHITGTPIAVVFGLTYG